MPPRIDIRSGGPELGNRSVKERGTTALRHAGTKRWRDQQRSEPPRSPDLNAYAERFVRSIKEECLDKLIDIGERNLRMAIGEYVEHYHAKRNHQGLDNALIAPASEVGELSGLVLRRERLDGMLNYYHRKAA